MSIKTPKSAVVSASLSLRASPFQGTRRLLELSRSSGLEPLLSPMKGNHLAVRSNMFKFCSFLTCTVTLFIICGLCETRLHIKSNDSRWLECTGRASVSLIYCINCNFPLAQAQCIDLTTGSVRFTTARTTSNRPLNYSVPKVITYGQIELPFLNIFISYLLSFLSLC